MAFGSEEKPPHENYEHPPDEPPDEEEVGDESGGGQVDADPVQVATGLFTLSETDVTLPGIGLGISFTRSYSVTAIGKNLPFGPGWDHNYNQRIEFWDDPNLIRTCMVRPGNGRAHASEMIDDGPGEDETWLSKPFAPGMVRKHERKVDGNGNAYVFSEDENGLMYYYEETYEDSGPSYAYERLMVRRITDEWGNSVRLDYNQVTGLLEKITAPGGKFLTINYIDLNSSPSVESWRISKITDSESREWTYTYVAQGSNAGLLKTVTTPSQETTTYYYDVNKNLKRTYSPDADSPFVNHYDGRRRVIKQDIGPEDSQGNRAFYTFNYELTDNLLGDYTEVIDPEGNVTWYLIETHSSGYKVIKGKLEYETPGSLNTALYTVYNYNDQMALSSTTHLGAWPEVHGIQHVFVYDTENTDPNLRRNLKQKKVSPSGGSPTLLEEWDFEGRRVKAYRDARTNAENALNGTSIDTVTYDYFYGTHPNGTLGLPDGSTYLDRYDRHHRDVTLPDGSVQSITESWDFNDKGQLIEYTDPRGIVTTYTYNVLGLQEEITVDFGGVGNPATQAVTKMFYDAVGNLTQVIDPEGRTTDYQVDINQNAPQKTTGPGAVPQERLEKNLGYSDAGHLLTEGLVDDTAFGDGEAVTEWIYDPHGYGLPIEVIRDIDANNQVHVKREYDAIGRVIHEYFQATGGTHNPSSDRHTSYEYDFRGLPKKITLHCPEVGAQDVVREFTYNSKGLLVAEHRGGWLVDEREYDDYERLWKIHRKDGAAVISTTEFLYDENNNITRVKELDSTGSLLSNVLTDYDEANRAWKIRRRYLDHNGNSVGSGYVKSLYYHDESGNVVSEEHDDRMDIEREFDGLGRLVKEGDQLVNPQVTRIDREYDRSGFLLETKERLYDENGNETLVETSFLPDDQGRVSQSTSALGTTTTEYDRRGRVARVTSPEGVIQEWYYDEAGNVRIEATVTDPSTSWQAVGDDPNDVWTEFVYDDWGRLSEVTRKDPNGVGDEVTKHYYDAAGRRIRTVRQEGTPEKYEEAYTYGVRGNLDTVTKSVSNTLDVRIDHDYGPRGELAFSTLQPVDPTNGNLLDPSLLEGATHYQWEYDQAGRLEYSIASVPSDFSVKVSRLYDSLGNVRQETLDVDLPGAAHEIFVTNADYNNNGLLKELTYPSLQGAKYKYDSHSRPDRLDDRLAGTLLEYDFLGQSRISHHSSQHIESFFSYGLHGRPESIQHQSVTSSGQIGIGCVPGCPCPPPPPIIRPIYDHAVGYDGDGRTTYSNHDYYDSSGALMTTGANVRGEVPEYNSLGRTISVYENVPASQMGAFDPVSPPTSHDRLVELDYERRGLRKSVTDGTTTDTYTNNNVDELTSLNGSNWNYDKRGATTKTIYGGVVTDYGFDGFGGMVRTDVGGDESHFYYDADGRRVAVERSDGSTQYFVSWGSWLTEVSVDDGAGVEREVNFYYRLGERAPEALRKGVNAAPIYLLKDTLGSIRVAARDTQQDPGIPLEQYRSDWFGVPRVFIASGGAFVEDSDARSSLGNQFVAGGEWVDPGAAPYRVGLGGRPLLVEVARPLSGRDFGAPLGSVPEMTAVSAAATLDLSPGVSAVGGQSSQQRRRSQVVNGADRIRKMRARQGLSGRPPAPVSQYSGPGLQLQSNWSTHVADIAAAAKRVGQANYLKQQNEIQSGRLGRGAANPNQKWIEPVDVEEDDPPCPRPPRRGSQLFGGLPIAQEADWRKPEGFVGPWRSSDPQSGTIIQIGYTEAAAHVIHGQYHGFAMIIDSATGETYITRAGPGVPSIPDFLRVGSDELGFGNLRARGGIWSESLAFDRPSITLARQDVGWLDLPFKEVVSRAKEFESITNAAQNPYEPFGQGKRGYNSNSYAWTFVESLGFRRPKPILPSPGWATGRPSKKLSYYPVR